jgi:hypothetical protein
MYFFGANPPKEDPLGMKLQFLYCNRDQVKSLNPLANCINLQKFIDDPT